MLNRPYHSVSTQKQINYENAEQNWLYKFYTVHLEVRVRAQEDRPGENKPKAAVRYFYCLSVCTGAAPLSPVTILLIDSSLPSNILPDNRTKSLHWSAHPSVAGVILPQQTCTLTHPRRRGRYLGENQRDIWSYQWSSQVLFAKLDQSPWVILWD